MEKKRGNKEIYNIIENNKNIDFVAFVITQWHVHSLEAAILKLESKFGRKLNGIVIIKSHPQTGYAIDYNVFSRKYIDVIFFEDDEYVFDIIKSELFGILYYLSLKNEGKKQFFVLRPSDFRYPVLGAIDRKIGSDRSVMVVELDEGTATYLNDKKSWLVATINEQLSIKGKIKAYIKYFEEKLLRRKKIIETGHYFNACLFSKNQQGECVQNNEMTPYYREAIKQFSIKNIVYNFECDEKYIIINPELPVSVFGLGVALHDQIVKKCIIFFSKKGYRVYIKPHPREKYVAKYEKFGGIIMDNRKISQETILSNVKNKPSYVVGFYSTALVTANALFDIKAISLAKLGEKEDESIICLNENAHKYIELFNKYVVFPVNFKELKEIID